MTKDKCMEFLRVELTKEEVYEFGRELARKNNELGQIEVDLQSVKAQFKERQTRVESSINTLSRLVSNGYDHREVECLIVWNKPIAGQCTIVRTDTGEEVRTRIMTLLESQELLPFADPNEKIADAFGQNMTMEHDGKKLETVGELRDVVKSLLSPEPPPSDSASPLVNDTVAAITRATAVGKPICAKEGCLRFFGHLGKHEPDNHKAEALDKVSAGELAIGGTVKGKKAKA
jgi:hypothetical protein